MNLNINLTVLFGHYTFQHNPVRGAALGPVSYRAVAPKFGANSIYHPVSPFLRFAQSVDKK